MLFKRFVAVILCELLVFLPVVDARAQQTAVSTPPKTNAPLRDYLQKPYLDLFELTSAPAFSAAELQAQRQALKKGEEICVKNFKARSKDYQKQIDAARKDLKKNTTKIAENDRKKVHCNIQNLDLLKSESDVLAGHAIPTAYDNLNAKLDLLQEWPAAYSQIKQEIASGSYASRRWGDVNDIGFREIEKGQQDDIKDGQKAVEEMKLKNLQTALDELARLVIQHRHLLIARVKITSYNLHRSAPFLRALVVYRCQVYSEQGADNVIQSGVTEPRCFHLISPLILSQGKISIPTSAAPPSRYIRTKTLLSGVL